MATMEQSWESIAAMGQQMQQLADDNNWPRIAELARLRHESVTGHFQHFPVSPGNAEFYQSHLHSFFQQEQQLKRVVDSARKNVLKDVNHHNHSRRAINAYQNAGKPVQST